MFTERERVKFIISTERVKLVKFNFTGKEGLKLLMFTGRERVKYIIRIYHSF